MRKMISDMYLAAAILAYGGDLLDINRDDPRRQKFIFDDNVEYIWVLEGNNAAKIMSPDLHEVETKFISQSLMFPPCYPDALRRIKSAIHSG